MGSKSDYLELKNLDHNLGTTTFTKPAAVYVGLFTVLPTDASTGAGPNEVPTAGSTGYLRRVITFGAAAAGAAVQGAQINFPQATAGWGTIVGYGIFDSVTPGAGNLLYWSDTVSKLVSTGDTLSIAAGAISITED